MLIFTTKEKEEMSVESADNLLDGNCNLLSEQTPSRANLVF